MAIRWDILAPALQSNPGEAFRVGLENGVTRSALGALAQNRNDQQAMSALAMFNPAAAMQFRDRNAEIDLREAQTAQQQLNNRRGDIIMGASFLDGVQDQAGYTSALQRARSAGVNIEGAPPQFDPTYVDGLRRTATALAQAQSRGQAARPYRWRANNGDLMEVGPDGQTRQVYRDPTARVQWIAADNGDGTRTMVPVGPTGPVSGAPAQDAPETLTDEDFLEEGGSGSAAPSGFPGEYPPGVW